MRTINWVALLLMSMAGNVMAQPSGPRLAEPGAKRKYNGLSHIEVDLGQRNTLLVGFDRYAQVQARQNVDSVLRLFVADYRKVQDTTQSPTRAVHALFRLGEADRGVDLRYTPQTTESFRFSDGEEPAAVKKQQDTLQVVWSITGNQATYYDFSIYLLVNDLSDIERFLKAGGVNANLRKALESVQQYKGHDLTSPRMSFDMIQQDNKEARFLSPGLAKSPFISFQPGVGVGLIRNQWVPSLNFEVQFVPTQLHNVGYSVSYLSNFFFSQSNLNDRLQTFRNDFLNVGVAFYYFNKDGQTSAFSRQIFSFYVGIPVHRSGFYFDRDAVRLSGTAYQKGLFKVQPELYMNGFFRHVNPGLKLVVGL
ncbi:hypothetical protein ACFSUS_05660 [Spirosoma soli]|uniref:DUF3570 domain-containing protein n=1 Tax=Spirosoma soli TaxID=1770529 RepID=A0ABW5M360_9BACT